MSRRLAAGDVGPRARHDGKVFLYAFDLIELSGERQVCEIRPGLYPARSIFCTAVAV
jgi:hypothetical protein